MAKKIFLVFLAGQTNYIVVDCGGGTVDLTVHELDNDTGVLKEVHKGTGGPCGATGKKCLHSVYGSSLAMTELSSRNRFVV